MPIGGGGRTPDDFPGDRIEDAILIVSGTLYPVSDGEITYVSGVGFQFMDEGVVKGLGSGSLTPTQHETLRQLIHLAEEGGPFEGFPSVVRTIGPAGSAFPTGSVWWTDSTMQQKIVEKIVTRNANQTPKTIQWKVYVSGSNTVAASVTDTITYSGIFETSRTRTSP
jgi:hypothetical protein